MKQVKDSFLIRFLVYLLMFAVISVIFHYALPNERSVLRILVTVLVGIPLANLTIKVSDKQRTKK